MNTSKDISQVPNIGDGLLPKLLEMLTEYFDEKKKEAHLGKHMLAMGAKTEFASDVETMIKDPLRKFSEMRDGVDGMAKSFIDFVVKTLITKNQDVVESAFRTNTNFDDLHYSIILKDDSQENRNRFYSFLNGYENTGYSNQFPIYLQFLPKELAKTLPQKESII